MHLGRRKPGSRSKSEGAGCNAGYRRKKSWRQKRDEVLRLQIELCARLDLLAKKANRHQNYKAARKLLTEMYRQKNVSKRLAVLNAAAWLTNIIEEVTSII